MNYETACKKLTEAGIPYTTAPFVNRFYGNRIIISTLKDARRASKLLDGMIFYKYKPGGHHTDFYH